MHQRAEQEIIKNWKDDIDKLIVSISNITYNYERYISDTLSGFLMQEANFPFEILVNDNYWTDSRKTQKQVKFLEECENYIISVNDTFIIDENKKHMKDSKLLDWHKKRKDLWN